MDFFIWHYSKGVKSYLHRWFYAMAWIVHYFSLTVIPLSLFSPWKRLVSDEDVPGFHPEEIFRQATFNLISRSIGAFVRSFIFLTGIIVFFPAFFAGIIGLVIWIIFPPLGLPYYLLTDKFGAKFFTDLVARMAGDYPNSISHCFSFQPGRFTASRLGIPVRDLISNASVSRLDFSGFQPANFTDIAQKLIDSRVWEEKFFHQSNALFSDLIMAAKWWDTKYNAPEDQTVHFNRSGLGLELLFGYTPQLNQCSVDLSIPRPFSHHLIGREHIVSRIQRSLNSGSSVIIVGQPGVGKKTIALEFARRAAAGELGQTLGFKRVLEFDYNFLLSQSLDVNQKKARLSQLLKEASLAGNVILVIKDIHRITNSGLEGLDFTDLFEQHLENKKLKIIAISSQVDYERFISRNLRLKKFFAVIEAAPSTPAEAAEIIVEAAHTWERQKHLVITTPALRTIIEGCDRYITETPFPEKAIEILDLVVSYADSHGKTAILVSDVQSVLTERTGISLASLTVNQKSKLADLENILHRDLVDQEEAVSLIAKSLRSRSVGTKNEKRPVGSFLFLGPTGVGKTQTAKALASVYYGSQENIIRFDMAEFSGAEGLERLIGSVNSGSPGALTTAIKNRPASLLLLDEIEKAPSHITNLLLTLLDEGYISDAFGAKIICSHLFVIATSNAGAEFIRQQVISQHTGKQLQKSVVEHVLQNHIYSPEFINRFDGVVVFSPLGEKELVKVAEMMVKDLQTKLLQKDIRLTLTPQLLAKLAHDGFVPEFGARAMRRIVDITLGDLIGKAILEDKLVAGSKLTIIPGTDPDDYSLDIS